MLRVFSTVLKEEIEVSQEGTFELPPRPYTSAELKKIAREVNKAIRSTSNDELVESYED